MQRDRLNSSRRTLIVSETMSGRRRDIRPERSAFEIGDSRNKVAFVLREESALETARLQLLKVEKLGICTDSTVEGPPFLQDGR